jgi:hypothetical protein
LAFEQRETRVEAAVEADHQRDAALLDHRNACLGAAAVEVERLFAEHRLAGARCGFDKVGVAVSRAGDYDRLYGGVGKSLRLTANRGAVAAGQPLRRDAVGIDDDAQPRIRMAGDISRVDRADAARAELAEIDHS